jgi:hypothetical protein
LNLFHRWLACVFAAHEKFTTRTTNKQQSNNMNMTDMGDYEALRLPFGTRFPVRIACKARGVFNHDRATAYLEVPENPPHGLILECSNPSCASTRRFRYCTVCQQPVAKRNFTKRHDHGLLKHVYGRVLIPADISPEDVTEPPTKRRHTEEPLDTAVIPDHVSGNPKAAGHVRSSSRVRVNVSTEMSTEELLSGDERAWLELYHARPKTPSSISDINVWLKSVLEIAQQQRTPGAIVPADNKEYDEGEDFGLFDPPNQAYDLVHFLGEDVFDIQEYFNFDGSDE